MSSFVGLLIATCIFHFEPYVGYHVGTWYRESVEESEDGEFSVKKSREFFAKMGLPYRFASLENFPADREVHFLFWPEFTIGTRVMGFALGAGPELQIHMGPSSDPMYLVAGTQAGFYYGYLYSEGSLGSGVSGADENLRTTNYSESEKKTFAGILNLYFGPKFEIMNSLSMKIQVNTQLYMGQIMPNTIRSSLNERIGGTAGLNVQAEF